MLVFKPEDLRIDDGIGIKFVGTPGELESMEAAIRRHPGVVALQREEHRGNYNDTNLLVDLALPEPGILVDLAHSSPASVERALEVARKPLIWSHSAISLVPQSWREPGNRSRLLEIGLARRIAAGGGAVGLWALRDTVHSAPSGYADEILRMIDLLGAEHVMFGSDTEGMGNGAAMAELTDLRDVADELARRGLDEATLRAVCFVNYARCLVQAMQGTS